jgi:hypothetical protein
MSYDPSHRRPPRQDRWPNATPQEGWPAYLGGDGDRDGRTWADAGAYAGAYAGANADAFAGVRNGRAAVNGYGAADGYVANSGSGDSWDG